MSCQLCLKLHLRSLHLSKSMVHSNRVSGDAGKRLAPNTLNRLTGLVKDCYSRQEQLSLSDSRQLLIIKTKVMKKLWCKPLSSLHSYRHRTFCKPAICMTAYNEVCLAINGPKYVSEEKQFYDDSASKILLPYIVRSPYRSKICV